MVKIKYYNLGGIGLETGVDKIPDLCPLCSVGIAAIYRTAFETVHSSSIPKLAAVFQCPRNECRGIFLAYYDSFSSKPDWFILKGTFLPAHSSSPSFPPIISTISPAFELIYGQAFVAEDNGLSEICGPGYRRALEFLVKDYLTYLSQGTAEEIEKIRTDFLSNCVKKIEDENIKATALRATWLGNDQTHYIRKWEDKDLQNLKALIQLVINWIHSSELTKQYISDMPE